MPASRYSDVANVAVSVVSLGEFSDRSLQAVLVALVAGFDKHAAQQKEISNGRIKICQAGVDWLLPENKTEISVWMNPGMNRGGWTDFDAVRETSNGNP